MWPRRSHLLQTLTAITSSKAEFKWANVEQKAFDDIKRNIGHDTVLACPYFNKPFDIHKDARNYQLGTFISQEVKPIAFYSRKLIRPQTQYTVT